MMPARLAVLRALWTAWSWPALLLNCQATADSRTGLQVTVKASAIVPARSAVLRGPMERAVLDLLTARLAAVSLAGYIFFGSSVNISDQACFQECPGMYRQITRIIIGVYAI